MKTPLCILLTVATASTLMAADLHRPTAGTRKQAQDAGDRPYTAEETNLFGRIFRLPEFSRPRGHATYDATTRANMAEDRNRESTVKGDATDGDKVPGR